MCFVDSWWVKRVYTCPKALNEDYQCNGWKTPYNTPLFNSTIVNTYKKPYVNYTINKKVFINCILTF